MESSTLSKIEHGHVEPNLSMLTKIAEALSITLEQLLHYDEHTQININNSNTSGNNGVNYGGVINDIEFIKQMLVANQHRIESIEMRVKAMEGKG